jgi:hypothetical protein
MIENMRLAYALGRIVDQASVPALREINNQARSPQPSTLTLMRPRAGAQPPLG